MALIALADFKSVLGVGNIYPDAELQSVMDAAEDTILALLSFKRNSIIAAQYDHASLTATYYTGEQPLFSVGEDCLIDTYAGAPFTGNQTVSAVGVNYFKTSKTHPSDHVLIKLKPAGTGTDNGQVGIYDTYEAVRQAAMAVAVDIWSTRLGTAGQTGVDFQPAPYRLGRSLYSRVSALIGQYMNAGSMVG